MGSPFVDVAGGGLAGRVGVGEDAPELVWGEVHEPLKVAVVPGACAVREQPGEVIDGVPLAHGGERFLEEGVVPAGARLLEGCFS